MTYAGTEIKSDIKEKINNIIECSGIDFGEINAVTDLKKGMTNRSFLVNSENGKYILKIPGEGTERLINRYGEAMSYQMIAGRGIGDEVLYLNPATGCKITRFWEKARCCNAYDNPDVFACMDRLKTFHALQLSVDYTYDIFRQITFYESLRGGRKSVFKDYVETKERILEMQPFIEKYVEVKSLTHIDAVPDNFLFIGNKSGKEEVRLIDWEYAALQDPHVDIAMFCIYAFYDRGWVDKLIDIYFAGRCSKETRIKIYCYIAACGLLWSNWCEYKEGLGVSFGEYAKRQYRYAVEYCQIVGEELGKL